MTVVPAGQVQFRQDLERSYQVQQGKSYLVIKDPLTRRYFRFTQAQATIIELFSEAPENLEVIAERASAKLNSSISPATIEAFCKSLEEKLLIETPAIREKLGAVRGQRLDARSSLLYWKVGSIDPARIFDWLVPRTKWAFTPTFQILAVLLILTGFIITYSNWKELSGQAPALFSLYGLILIWPVVFTVTTIHEFSHGLTCRHYGGKVHEVGFMLIYFSPAFYCDVSDSYMFPQRTHRMAVALAGGFAQLTVWGTCTIIWRITESSAFINQLALIVVVFSGLQTLFNFNPLIKLDGYYMLSDFLEVPNLRSKALRSLWDWLAANGKSRWTMREKRAQIIYGAASFVFSTTLLIYVYSRLLTWVTTKYQLAGLVVFGVFANFTLRKAMVEPMEGVKAVATRVSIKRYRNIGIALAAVILSVVVKFDLSVTADPTQILPKENYSVTALNEGMILEILVHDGSIVHEGDKLAVMADFVKQDKLLDTTGRLNEQMRNLDDLRKGPRQEEIEAAEKTIERLKVERNVVFQNEQKKKQLQEVRAGRLNVLESAKVARDADQHLLDRGLISSIQAQKSQADVEIAESSVRDIDRQIDVIDETARNRAAELTAQIAEQEASLQLLMKGNRPDKISQVEEDVKRLRETVDRYSKELKKTDIHAPFDAVVSTPLVEELERKHRDQGEEIMKLAVTSKLRAELMVPELEYEDVQQGNDVSVRVKSFPSKEFLGKIDWIAPEAQTVDGQQMFRMYVYLDNEDGLLKPGMKGYAKIYCGKKRIIELMTRRIGRWIKFDLPKLW